jgi:hypothetical protein
LIGIALLAVAAPVAPHVTGLTLAIWALAVLVAVAIADRIVRHDRLGAPA